MHQPSSRPPRPADLRSAVLVPEALARLLRVLQLHDRELAESHGITASQWSALHALVREGPLPVTELGRELHLEKSTASRLADALLRKGMARKRSPGSDGRVAILQLTEAGLRLGRRMLNHRTSLWMDVLEEVDPDVRSRLATELHQLTAALTAEERG